MKVQVLRFITARENILQAPAQGFERSLVPTTLGDGGGMGDVVRPQLCRRVKAQLSFHNYIECLFRPVGRLRKFISLQAGFLRSEDCFYCRPFCVNLYAVCTFSAVR